LLASIILRSRLQSTTQHLDCNTASHINLKVVTQNEQKASLMRVQLIWTIVTEITVTLAGILLLKLAASLLGPVGFGEYTLTRRAIGLMYLPLVLGLGIAAPRYIAIARTGTMPGFTESAFAIATLTAGLIPAFLVALLLNLIPGTAATILFGTATLTKLVFPAALALSGMALHAMVYAVYRGRSEMGFANAMQLTNLGVVPVLSFLVASHTSTSVLTLTATLWLIVSAIALAHVLIRERSGWQGADHMRDHLRTLLKFGLPRVPGEFAMVGLFAIPSLIAVREHGVVLAGQFSAALSVLTMASGAFAPVGLVILPRVSAQAAEGDIPGVRHLVLRILGGGILLAGLGVAIGELLIPPFIRWYFGAAFIPAIPVFRACLLGAIPYAVYVLMRSILDALEVKALNTKNLVISLIVVVGLCLANSSIMWMSFSLVGSLVLLGVLTLRDTYARLRITPAPETQAIPA
jgi:O-antigen/teichoic acid export membrane protein